MLLKEDGLLSAHLQLRLSYIFLFVQAKAFVL